MDRLREILYTSGLVAREAVFSLRQNWGIGALSVVLALSLWVYVTGKNNPDQAGQVRGTIPVEAVNVPADRAVASISPASVTVRVRAPGTVFDSLSADDFRATIDLSAVTTHEATVAVVIVPQEPRADVLTISPAEVSVQLENVTSQTVSVRTNLVGTPPRGFDLHQTTVQPNAVVVKGPQRLIERVAVVEADVNLTGVRTNFQETLLLHARDDNGANIEGVNIEPESAVIRAEIVQVQFSAAFVVRPDISGTPANGYNASAISVDPSLVVVTGPAEAFSSIDPVQGIATEAVSIEGASADVVRTVALRLPQGATVDQPAVTVRVTIAPARGSFSYSVAVTATDVPDGLTATLAAATVQVVLVGSLPDLNAIDASAIVATVNLSGLSAGQQSVQVHIQAPSGVRIGSITPDLIAVTLRPS